MTAEQFRTGMAAGREAVRKLPWPFTLVPFVTVGVIDLIRAYRKHDVEDAIAVCVIFFVLGPLLSLWIRRKIAWD